MTSINTVLGLRQATLSLREHDPRWADLFEMEASLMYKALSGLTFDIDHIGSTVVPRHQVKPILNIALRLTEEAQISAALAELGYVDRGIRNGRLFILLLDGDVRVHNLHLYHMDDLGCNDQITFRNALRSEPKLRAQYVALKKVFSEISGTKVNTLMEKQTS